MLLTGLACSDALGMPCGYSFKFHTILLCNHCQSISLPTFSDEESKDVSEEVIDSDRGNIPLTKLGTGKVERCERPLEQKEV